MPRPNMSWEYPFSRGQFRNLRRASAKFSPPVLHLRRSLLQFLMAASASPFERGLYVLEVSNLMFLPLQNAKNFWHQYCGPPSALITD